MENYRNAARKTGLKPASIDAPLAEQIAAGQALYKAVISNLTEQVRSDPEWADRVESKLRRVSFYATTDPFEAVAEYTTAVKLGYAKKDEDLDRLCRSMYATPPKRLAA